MANMLTIYLKTEKIESAFLSYPVRFTLKIKIVLTWMLRSHIVNENFMVKDPTIFLQPSPEGDVIMNPQLRKTSRKIMQSGKKDPSSSNKLLNPSQIGYYGKAITELKKEELISALTDLSIMYLESKKSKEF